jgi:ribose 1,5-bisphosphokinase PhnN
MADTLLSAVMLRNAETKDLNDLSFARLFISRTADTGFRTAVEERALSRAEEACRFSGRSTGL